MADGDRPEKTDLAVQQVTLADLVASAGTECLELTDRWLGKRRDPRVALSIPVWVRFPAPDGFGPPCRFTLRDVSRRGIGLYAHLAFPCDQTVHVDLNVNDLAWSGRMCVRHCTETIGGFKVGLELIGDVPEPALPKPPPTNAPAAPPADPFKRRATLQQLKTEVRKAVRAYRLAQSSWGLLGIGVRQRIRRIVERQAKSIPTGPKDCQRRQPRVALDTGTRVIVPMSHSWHEVPAQILDVSVDGVTLVMSSQIVTDPIERELTGDLDVRVGMTLLVGLGYEPDRLWIPGEVLHSQDAGPNRVRVGVQFVTPSAMKLIGP